MSPLWPTWTCASSFAPRADARRPERSRVDGAERPDGRRRPRSTTPPSCGIARTAPPAPNAQPKPGMPDDRARARRDSRAEDDARPEDRASARWSSPAPTHRPARPGRRPRRAARPWPTVACGCDPERWHARRDARRAASDASTSSAAPAPRASRAAFTNRAREQRREVPVRGAVDRGDARRARVAAPRRPRPPYLRRERLRACVPRSRTTPSQVTASARDSAGVGRFGAALRRGRGAAERRRRRWRSG